MKNVFIIIPWFLPAYRAGGPVQSIAHMVEHFSDDFSFKIFCSDTDLGGDRLSVTPDIWIPWNTHTQVKYISKKNNTLALFKRDIKASDPGVLFINGIYSWNFTLIPLLFARQRKIVSARGMLHPGALSQKSFKKKIYLFVWKLFRLYKRCDFHASTEQEKIYIEKIFGKKIKVCIAQNFPGILPRLPFREKIPGTLQMISVALISPMKNHLEVIRSLMKNKGPVSYNIYGPVKDAAYWNACREEIKMLPSNIVVNYHGDIPHSEVANVLSKNQVFILPSKSENFGHALYEALSAGKPVITSHNTPWNNLRESMAGINVDLQNPEALTAAIDFFADMTAIEFDKWSKGANEYAAKAIDIDEIRSQYLKMFLS